MGSAQVSAAGKMDAADRLEQAVAMIAKVGSCGSPTFSPDGRQLAYVADLTGSPQVWRVATKSGWPQLVTALDDPISAVAWSPDGVWLALQLAPGGGMNQQIYVVRPDGSDLRQLTAGGQTNNRLGRWVRDGHTLALASNQRTASAMDAYLVDNATGQMRLVAQNQGVGAITDISADGLRAVL